MPIKWTPEVDQILLLKILETSQLNANVKAISAAWPDTHEKPTARAITERLVKIRNGSKIAGTASHFSVSGKTSSQGGTPRKPRAPNPNGVKKNTTPKKDGKGAASGKRNRGGRLSDEDLTDDSEAEVVFKSEIKNTHTFNNEESPSKKPMTISKTKVEVKSEAAEANGRFHDSGFETGFGGDGAEDMEEGMYA